MINQAPFRTIFFFFSKDTNFIRLILFFFLSKTLCARVSSGFLDSLGGGVVLGESFWGSWKFLESLLEFVVWGSPGLEKIVVEELALLSGPEFLPDGGEEWVGVEVLPGGAVVGVLQEGDGSLSEIEWNLSVPVVVSVQGLSVEVSDEVVSDDVDLLPSSEEGLGGGEVVDVSETEDVVVLVVAEGLVVDVQESVLGEEAGLLEEGVRLGGDQGVEVIVVSVFDFSASDVLDGDFELVLVDLDEVLSVLDSDSLFLEFLLDELVGGVIVLDELVVGVQDGEGGSGVELSVELEVAPDFQADEEVVGLNLSSEWVWWKAEVGVT